MNYRYIDNISNKSREATMRLYGSIGDKIDGDMFEKERASLDRLDLDLVKIQANTPGGNVFQGMSIVSAIMSMDTPVHVYVDGVVASMGAVITVAADRVVMMDFSQLMIHDPYFIDTLPIDISPKQQKMLSMVLDMLEQALMRRGMDRAEIATLSTWATWFSAAEAKAHGFWYGTFVSHK